MVASTIPWETVQQTFRRIWGYDDFRPPQAEIIRGLLDQRDTLVILPTGGGKSLCFQLPALLQSGVTLVLSPLVALMENQVQELREHQLPAATLHSELSPHQRRQVLRALEANRLRLLYLSPETLLSPPVWQRLRQPSVIINGLILDEAHCLVQWGDSFRPVYRRLGAVRPALLAQRPPGTRLPIAAFTATADPTVQRTLIEVLRLQQPHQVRLNPYRSNLHLATRIVWSPRQRRQTMQRFIQQRSGQAGLVYVRSRQDSEDLAAWLMIQGQTAAAYHAGLSSGDRRRIEMAWSQNQVQTVVCTSAFGMGVNKPDTRWVLHYQAPSSLTEYVQEVGRAGRDGRPAEALTLMSEPTGWLDPMDQQRWRFFTTQTQALRREAQHIARQIPAVGSVAQVQQQFKQGAIALAWLHGQGRLTWSDPFHYRLLPGSNSTATLGSVVSAMQDYLSSRRCRWQHLLEQFGFGHEARQLGTCGHCDRCQRS
ncbi:RNA helicase CrhR [Halomicronema hongdechloris C2206]|uniref:DNA 3'-5' helicase n=1 Tax=Halomicronema hongdechloris C2206 TaxID=1641165 RepID=A0A1Z3HRL0_9CYAN|nr:ATP-dependent DNA helicase RecQ [Halomicronema hongdechloris]ASC72918.1 RNA helicase CrhR [Halomicronema hongdechloris C2206]